MPGLIGLLLLVGMMAELAPRDYDALMLPVGRFPQSLTWDRASTACELGPDLVSSTEITTTADRGTVISSGPAVAKEGWVRSTCAQRRPVRWVVSCSWAPGASACGPGQDGRLTGGLMD